jgi:hypothetical protein
MCEPWECSEIMFKAVYLTLLYVRSGTLVTWRVFRREPGSLKTGRHYTVSLITPHDAKATALISTITTVA